MEGKFSDWRAWRANCLIGGRPPGWRTLVSYGGGPLRVKMLRSGKLVLGASLLALPMKPEEATNTQDIVGKASAIIWFHSTTWPSYLFKPK